jgi:hypothetical protein
VVCEIVEFIKGTYPRGSGIVYTFTRNEAEVRLTKEALAKTCLLVCGEAFDGARYSCCTLSRRSPCSSA